MQIDLFVRQREATVCLGWKRSRIPVTSSLKSRRFELTAPGLVKLRNLAVELLELVKTNMPKTSGEQNV